VEAMGSLGYDEAGRLAATLGALAHPVRLRIVADAEEGVKLSASGLQHAMPDVPLGTLSYHVRCLADAGLIRSAGTAPRRGATEHFYLVSPVALQLRAQIGQLLEVIRERG
jgi:DNA-binding transcriptional ArsR family regulator